MLSVIAASCILFSSYAYKPYYSPPNTIGTWQSAQTYCQDTCNSDLVSLHNKYEYLEIINYLRFNTNTSNHTVWIGLNNKTNTVYSYSDGSSFDFPTNISGYPWSTDTNIYETNCVYIDPANNYLLNNKDCNDKTYQTLFVCNYCYSPNDDIINDANPEIPHHAYYTSDNRGHIQFSMEFCYNFCDSDIVSFHSKEDHNFAKYMALNHRSIDLWDSEWQTDDVWIGLTDIYASNSMFWIDNTPFNYGNYVPYKSGIAPWATGQPLEHEYIAEGEIIGDLVYQMEADQDYRWKETAAGIESFAMCTHCNSKINKYIMVYAEKRLKFDDAELFCQDVMGTDLASIHSVDDMDQLLFIVQHLGGDWKSRNIYIGLKYDAEIKDFIWIDGTSYDFGGYNITNGKIPWNQWGLTNITNVTDTDLCVYFSNDLGGWMTTDCDTEYTFICNTRSELYGNYNRSWHIATGEASWNNSNIIINDISNGIGDDHIMFIEDKQWINTNGNVSIQFNYAVIGSDNNNAGIGDVGIIIYNHATDCGYYYIGISPSKPKVFIATLSDIGNASNITNYNVIAWTDYAFDRYEYDRYYTLKINIINSSNFEVFINDNLTLNYSDTETRVSNSILSGHIGIKTNINIIAKSLFISGTPYKLNNKSLYLDHFCTFNIDIKYGEAIEIVIKYTLKEDIETPQSDIYRLINDVIKDILTDDTKDLCLISNDYNIIITQDIYFSNKGRVSATLYLCDLSTTINIFNDLKNNLQKDFINGVNKNISLISNDVITEIQVFDPRDIISTTTTTTLQSEDLNKANDNFINVIFGISGGVLICCICILSIYVLYRIKRENKEYEEKHAMIIKHLVPKGDVIKLELTKPISVVPGGNAVLLVPGSPESEKMINFQMSKTESTIPSDVNIVNNQQTEGVQYQQETTKMIDQQIIDMINDEEIVNNDDNENVVITPYEKKEVKVERERDDDEVIIGDDVTADGDNNGDQHILNNNKKQENDQDSIYIVTPDGNQQTEIVIDGDDDVDNIDDHKSTAGGYGDNTEAKLNENIGDNDIIINDD